jgi:hypothetical protein
MVENRTSGAQVNAPADTPNAPAAIREMVGRIFDRLRRPRRIVPVPVWLWRLIFFLAKPLFPDANLAIGIRMMKDMAFDSTPAAEAFGWKPRLFHPVFD